MSMTLIERIQTHLKAGGVVVISTMTRHTVYKAKHAAMFTASNNDAGINIGWPGKRRVYAFAYQVRFAQER